MRLSDFRWLHQKNPSELLINHRLFLIFGSNLQIWLFNFVCTEKTHSFILRIRQVRSIAHHVLHAYAQFKEDVILSMQKRIDSFRIFHEYAQFHSENMHRFIMGIWCRHWNKSNYSEWDHFLLQLLKGQYFNFGVCKQFNPKLIRNKIFGCFSLTKKCSTILIICALRFKCGYLGKIDLYSNLT